MKRTGTGRVFATLFLGVISGIYLHYRQMRELAEGRDAYLAQRSHYFDRITQLHSVGLTLVAGIILAVVAVGVYELIATGITSILPPSTAEE